jgi:hypothetical protein
VNTGGKDNKTRPVWLLPLIIVLDTIFVAALAFFIIKKPQPGLEYLVRLVDAHFAWILAGIGLFVALTVIVSLSKSHLPREALKRVADGMGWSLEKRWGLSRSPSPFPAGSREKIVGTEENFEYRTGNRRIRE